MNDGSLISVSTGEQEASTQAAFTEVDDAALSTLADGGDEKGVSEISEAQESLDGAVQSAKIARSSILPGSEEANVDARTAHRSRVPSSTMGGSDQNAAAQEAEPEDGEDGDYTQAISTAGDASAVQDERHLDGDTSLHYVNGAERGQDNENASTSLPRSSSSRSLSHHTKRRKINTCLPCKRRKVKCDREKPYCGQCKKSSIPADECTWSAVVEPNSGSLPLSAAHALFPSASFASVGDASTANTSSATQWYDPSNSSWNQFSLPSNGTADGNATQVLLERIAALEAIIESSRLNVRREGVEGDGEENGDANIFASSIESDAGIAADALAMIARQASSTLPLTTTEKKASKLRCPRLFADVEAVLADTTATEVRHAVSLLPHLPVLSAMLEMLDSVQNSGIYIGLPVKLCTVQINHMASITSTSQAIDLSLVAAALAICAVGLDLFSAEQVAEQSLVDSDYAIPALIEEWSSACEALLRAIEYDSRPNINVLIALALRRHLQSSNGLTIAASATLQTAIQLARGMGIDKLHDQREDEARWASMSAHESDDQEESADVVYAITLLTSSSVAGKEASMFKAPWLSRESALVRESARSLYTYFALQDWLSDPFSSVSIPVLSSISLPLPLEPVDASESYPIQSEEDFAIVSSSLVLRYTFLLTRSLATWKHEGRVSAAAREAEKGLIAVQRPSAFQVDVSDIEGSNTIAIQNTRAWTELVRSYCLFVVQRAEASMADQCIESAVNVLQNRSALGTSFPAPLHKFFDVQRFTLEAALMIVIYLHQYGAQNSEERRQSLQSLIDDAYAQPGFENAHSLLSLSFDVQDDIEAQMTNGNKRAAPDEDLLLASNQGNDGGLKLSNGRRLSSSHPIVTGLRMFVHGQSLPFGNTRETVEFWDAIGRQSQLFLVA